MSTFWKTMSKATWVSSELLYPLRSGLALAAETLTCSAPVWSTYTAAGAELTLVLLLPLPGASPAFTFCRDSYLCTWSGRREGLCTHRSRACSLGSSRWPGQPLLPVGTMTYTSGEGREGFRKRDAYDFPKSLRLASTALQLLCRSAEHATYGSLRRIRRPSVSRPAN